MPSDLTPPQGAPLDFDTLALLHLDGLLDPAQRETFSRLIALDPVLANRLAGIAELHAALGELGRTSIAPARSAGSISTRSHRRSRRLSARMRARRLPFWGLAAAAMLALGLTLGLILSNTGARDELLVTHGSVILERGNERLRVGRGTLPLRAGDHLLTSTGTTARITSHVGDRVDLASGTLLAWAPPHAAVSLLAGAVTADITPRPAGAPFLVSTPKADLIVVGTRFTVQADEAQSLLAVDHGRVRLSNRLDHQQVEVTAQQMTVTSGAGALAASAGGLPPAAANGLTGDYYNNLDFTAWRLRRIDAAIDFDWGEHGPDPRIGSSTFSVRWSGWLVPSYSGPCTFTFLIDDGVRLWLDGRLVLDEWHLSERLEFSTTVTLEAGHAYPIRLDFYQDPKDALIRWYWSTTDHPKQIVPGAWLRPLGWTPGE